LRKNLINSPKFYFDMIFKPMNLDPTHLYSKVLSSFTSGE
jgi:hypothetical protein